MENPLSQEDVQHTLTTARNNIMPSQKQDRHFDFFIYNKEKFGNYCDEVRIQSERVVRYSEEGVVKKENVDKLFWVAACLG